MRMVAGRARAATRRALRTGIRREPPRWRRRSPKGDWTDVVCGTACPRRRRNPAAGNAALERRYAENARRPATPTAITVSPAAVCPSPTSAGTPGGRKYRAGSGSCRCAGLRQRSHLRNHDAPRQAGDLITPTRRRASRMTNMCAQARWPVEIGANEGLAIDDPPTRQQQLRSTDAEHTHKDGDACRGRSPSASSWRHGFDYG